MGRLHVKFHDNRCKGEAVMHLKPFYLTVQSLHRDLELWPVDPKVHRAHTWLMGRLHVKFHEARCKGEAVMCLKPFYLTARLQTDGQTGWFQYNPLTSLGGGGGITITINFWLFKKIFLENGYGQEQGKSWSRLGLERFRIFTVRFDFDSHTLDSIFFESVLLMNLISWNNKI